MTDQLPQRRPAPGNLGGAERGVSLTAGTLLALNGVRHGGLLGLAQLVAGAAAVWRGYTGVCQIKQALDRSRQVAPRRYARKVITRSISIDKPRSEVFEFCREPLNIGALIPWIEEIEEVGDNLYRWRASGPVDRVLQCTLTRQISAPAQRLRWSTVWNGPWDHDVIVDFSDTPTGTQVRVIVACRSTRGIALTGLLGKFADKALLHLLRSIKAQLESGEVSAQTMGGEASKDFLFVHPARNLDTQL
ncbi:cyclase/dehydrase [Pseudomonas sp. dw_358]|uniref:SRPBCC family protein n=1 Tax=Pseudomonas sp. dw_358 TaxID=2720083 RepID=UPI001BD68533|nr:cyclase/dehydrase [Pseudomonas sp. dw_358]